MTIIVDVTHINYAENLPVVGQKITWHMPTRLGGKLLRKSRLRKKKRTNARSYTHTIVSVEETERDGVREFVYCTQFCEEGVRLRLL